MLLENEKLREFVNARPDISYHKGILQVETKGH